MRVVFNLISIAIVIVVIFLAALNMQTISNFTVWINAKGGHSIVFPVTMIHLILLIFVAGCLAGTCWAATFYSPVQRKLKEYQRKLEKTSVQTDEESSKVEVLEAKIQTLEKALQDALNKD